MREAHDKRDPGHMQWLWDIADHSQVCLEQDGPTVQSEALAMRLGELRQETTRILGVANYGLPWRVGRTAVSWG
jgi:hypothetical protein